MNTVGEVISWETVSRFYPSCSRRFEMEVTKNYRNEFILSSVIILFLSGSSNEPGSSSVLSIHGYIMLGNMLEAYAWCIYFSCLGLHGIYQLIFNGRGILIAAGVLLSCRLCKEKYYIVVALESNSKRWTAQALTSLASDISRLCPKCPGSK